jgi:hypothetical protein
MTLAAFLLIMLGLIAAEAVVAVRHRRRVDRLAELAGIRRFPGESTYDLEERIGRRFVVLAGGARR